MYIPVSYYVQKICIPKFLDHKDVIVQSPTGSGKTLAFVLPILELLLREKPTWKKWEIGALILLPSRELATQVSHVIAKFMDVVGLRQILFIGGSKTSDDIENFKTNGANIVVGTPGRLEELIENKEIGLTGHFRSLSVLIFDEADRLLDMGFRRSIQTILSRLPKQRQTGLFSATQDKDMQELVKTGLRNPFQITVGATTVYGEDSTGVVPTSLKNYFLIVDEQSKVGALAHFLAEHKAEKTLVFFSTCACVEYFSVLLNKVLDSTVLVLHGKKKRKQREKAFLAFQKLNYGVMVCTDVMARGIDVPDIDWVVQFDPPKKSSWFVHRCGRSGRCGRQGNGLVMLMPSEETYVEFLKNYEKVQLQPLALDLPEGIAAKTRRVLLKLAKSDRSILKNGTRAFVSYIQSYSKHDCHLVCSLRELDVVNVAHSYGLLRLPIMPELRGRDLSGFQRSTMNTADIAFKDKTMENERQQQLQERRNAPKMKKKAEKQPKAKNSRPKAKRELQQTEDDWDDLAKDIRLMKKLKKGKLSKTEFDEQFLDV